MKKFARVLTVGAVLFAIVASATFVGNLVYRKYTNWRFGDHVIQYSRDVDRRAAYAAFELAKPHLRPGLVDMFEERLTKEEWEYQNPFAWTIKVTLDGVPFTNRSVDSFRDIMNGIYQAMDRDDSPRSEVYELMLASSGIDCVAWPFILEDLEWPEADGSTRVISYQEYLQWKDKFDPLEQQMNTLLAAYERH